ncbi:response regulator [Desulfocurvus sp.]|uniref:response regulator n=1 Tax=Desulfocurvus sp. TaxID=2871698 RepID=UPI0025BA5BC8|nr:response regulator [Desulfocurvus sp.]MCK9241390.1 response regulator [Desulfocurvus sp.]
MVVEDEFIIALALRRQIEAMGLEVCHMTDGVHDALEFARSQTVDVALMDVSLRGGDDGIEAARRLVNEFGVPVVVISAYPEQHIRARAEAAGACAVLGKPASEAELCRALALALGAC